MDYKTLFAKNINLDFNIYEPDNLIAVNNAFYFTAYDNIYGNELWRSDGTAEGTVLVKDINLGSSSSYLENLTEVNGNLYFTRNNFDNDGSFNRKELWKSNGNGEGTILLEDTNLDSNISEPDNLIEIDNTLYFTAYDNVNGLGLWKTSGTSEEIIVVKDFDDSVSYPNNFIEINKNLYFTSYQSQLWRSDGTAEGTVLVKDINSGVSDSNPDNFIEFDGNLYFTAEDGTNGRELWKSDGTAEGTVLVKDINPGVSDSNPDNFIEFDSTLYFNAYNNDYGFELWQSDGTAEGTVLVKDINPGVSDSNPDNLTEVNGNLYFTANDRMRGKQLWYLTSTPPPTISFKVETSTSIEGTEKVITLIRSGEDLTQASQVTVNITGITATAEDDFEDTFRTITFAAGETETSFTIPLIDNASLEETETIQLSLTAGDNASITLEGSEAIVDIIDNDDVAPSPLSLTGGTAQIAYVAYYGRPADKGGLDYWNDVLTGSEVIYSPREGDILTGGEKQIYNQIVNAFGDAEEAERLFGEFDNNREKVNQVYQFAFNRDAETEGLDYWTEQIDKGNVTLANAALEVALGAQNDDIVILNNKIESANLFTNSINTQAEKDAYQGFEGEIFGRNWLEDYGNTISPPTEVDSALSDLIN